MSTDTPIEASDAFAQLSRIVLGEEPLPAILERLGKTDSLMSFVPDRPGHDLRYSVDTTKLQALGWATTFSQT